MQLKYGSYAFALNEAQVTSNVNHVTSPLGTRVIREMSYSISGFLQSSDGTQNTLNTQLITLQNALLVDNQDFQFILNDATTVGVQSLLNAGSIRGVKVQGYAYPTGQGAEGGAFRSYTITAKAEYVVSSPPQYSSFTESITFKGGGQKFVIKPALIGPPQKQITQQQTSMWAFQRGEATGFLAYPLVPAPIYPNDIHFDQSSSGKKTPKFAQYQNTDFGVFWDYVMESANGFSGSNPTFITNF